MNGGVEQATVPKSLRATVGFENILVQLKDVVDRQELRRGHESASLLNALR